MRREQWIVAWVWAPGMGPEAGTLVPIPTIDPPEGWAWEDEEENGDGWFPWAVEPGGKFYWKRIAVEVRP